MCWKCQTMSAIWTAHLNFVSRSSSSMVLELSSSPLVKKRQISSYCRHILTIPAQLNFIRWSSTTRWGEPRQNNWLLKMEKPALSYLDISSTFELHKQVYIFKGSGASILKKRKSSPLVKKTSDIKLMQTYFDISSTFKLHKQVYMFKGSRA